MSATKIKVAIAGASGYTGAELVRLLLRHPNVELMGVSSERNAGMWLHELHPQLQNLTQIRLKPLEEIDLDELDTLFLALPHRVSMLFVEKHHPLPCKVIDLSGDFRMTDTALYEKWYQTKHVMPALSAQAAYGLPELFRDQIQSAQLIANPGCYPTSAILPLAPLVNEKLIEPDSVVIDAKSGITGAGISPKANTHFPHAYDNFSAYGMQTHRHSPEIEQTVQRFTGQDVIAQFTPHLLPVNRGILTATYSTCKKTISPEALSELYHSYYGEEYFIRLRSDSPQLRFVRASNFCDIYASYDPRTNRIITLSAIDNLMKGAAGQAVQNMNLINNLKETTGLTESPVCP
ncbi:N-acetyl-gamma-glutamyl-phosphate reductase [Cyclonatronum proteinivorum]|uniref:N-acetyl-gamma-glutamyl-phosphate reductase n=1 Tax=Cyclonatronum proteinivorum TaxID=1457365 RepID=A0A345UIW0_9BACT|nr:N-acetyl-gamma-glutamyl-phosphate reductase [Cyclonatronum proteinivorum]AXJ00412.1 N-acetyl-gamma-glutamyl-phosphate reductase [Cyclonatronum proteinivorum]